MFVTLLAVVYTYTGKAWDRSYSWIERTKDPKEYWLAVAVYYLFGLVLIGVYLYQIHAFSN